MKKRKIVVLHGGEGFERDVSLRSGNAVASALRENPEFDVIPFEVESFEEVEKIKTFGEIFVFIALHGSWGEDGRLQRELEIWGIPFSGSDSRSSLLSMDKSLSREIFSRSGIKVPKGFVFSKGEELLGFSIPISIGHLGFPCVVKPCSGGSTVGVTVVRNQNQLRRALDVAFNCDDKILIEEFIDGKELTVAVLGTQDLEALPVIEIAPKNGFYGYEEKYTAGVTEYLCPAPIDEEISIALKKAAVKAHIALGCSVYSRADIRLSTNNEPYMLEVNTVPGMTDTSLVPKAAAAAGISFTDFLTRIIEMSS